MGIAAMFASFIMGLIYMVIGSLASWVGGFYIYGFGELLELTEASAFALKDIRYTLSKMDKGLTGAPNASQPRVAGAAPQNYQPAQNYQNTPAWQRVQMEQEQKQQQQEQQQ